MRARLTKRTIDAARYERQSGTHYVWDTGTAGFGLRVYPSGIKAFVVTYRVRGKQRFYTVGRYGELTLKQARAEALGILARSRKGEDPSAERRAYRRSPAMNELAKRCVKEHSRVHKKPRGAREDERRWRVYVLPNLGHRRVADIDRSDIADLMSSLSKTPGMANNIHALLSKSFNLAEMWGWRREGSNPCRHVPRFKFTNRERYLTARELARLSQVLAEAERQQKVRPAAITAIRLLILTGCRLGEILTLRWEEVDLEAKCLRLPDSKTGAKVVHLNGPALKVLASIARVEGNPYVIPGRTGTHLKSLRAPWERIRSWAKIEDVRIHDLRHTYASIGVNLGLSLQMVGKALGHSEVKTTERYAHLAADSVREANNRIGERIDSLMAHRPEELRAVPLL